MSVDFVGIRALVGSLGDMPAEVRANLRKELRVVGQSALSKARSNASWSSRIPPAISVRVSTRGDKAGVYLRVDAARAPHARPYEGIGSRGATFRHPVFGDRDAWVTQATRPYLVPAVQAVRDEALRAAEQAVLNAARAARLA